MSMLTLQNVCAGYRGHPVLTNINLTMEAGEICMLLGENGCGKTTLLRTIQGSVPLTTGQIWINGIDLADTNVKKRARLVTTMTQTEPPIEGVTGMDRIEMGFYPTKGLFGKLDIAEREGIHTLAKQFDIEPLLQRDLAAMSAGERQMIALLRAAVQDTPVLLLDEPASALDFNHTEILFAILTKMARQGKAILMILHDPTNALRHGDRVLYMTKKKRQNELMRLQELPDPRNYAEAEHHLRQLYPGLQIHGETGFCYLETKNIL